MSLARAAALAAVLVAVTAPAASAACTGTDSTVKVCLASVSPTGGSLYSDCVVVATSPDRCVPVSVPGPSWDGPLVQEVTCGPCGGVPDLPDTGALVDEVDDRLLPIAERISRMECAPAGSRSSAEAVRTLDSLRENVGNLLDSCLGR